MTCWTELGPVGTSGTMDPVGGPNSVVYAVSSTPGISTYSALDGSLITADYMPLAGIGFPGMAVPDTDGTVLYYSSYNGTHPELRKTVAGGSDTAVGNLAYSGTDIYFSFLNWIPGLGLVGFGDDQQFPVGNIGLYLINETTAALTLLVSNVIVSGGGQPIVTSDNFYWWMGQTLPSLTQQLHVYDGSTVVTATLGPQHTLLTFNPDDPTQVVVTLGTPASPDLRFYALSGGTINEVGTSSCEDLPHDGYKPIFTFDYTAADNWGDAGTQLWRFQAVTDQWHVGGVYW